MEAKEVLSCVHLRDLIQSHSSAVELLQSDLANKDELFRKYYFLMLLKKSTSAPVIN